MLYMRTLFFRDNEISDSLLVFHELITRKNIFSFFYADNAKMIN